MLAREESASTYVGEQVASPHGTLEGRPPIRRAREVTVAIGIAAKGGGQVEVPAEPAGILLDPDRTRSNRREEDPVEQRTVAVGSASGLHARPAALLVMAAAAAPAPVRIRVGDGRAVDARSMLSVLSLGAKHGTVVTLEADGAHAGRAVAELAALLERDLDAEPDAS